MERKPTRKTRKARVEAAAARKPREIPAWAWPAAIAVAVLAFYWAPLTSASASIQWDAADLHYPLQKYFAEHLLSGKLPFWTPYLFSGYPLLANPEIGAWYPPHWPFFLLGITPLAIQAELVLNAFLACWGMFLLCSRLVGNRAAALAGAFCYGLSGFFAGHSSHMGLFSAACLFPWLLLAFRSALTPGAWRYIGLGGLAGGAMILAGYFQTALYGFLALGLWAVAEIWLEPRRWGRVIAGVGGMLALALAVAAVQILPGLELTSHSVRRGMNFAASTEGVLELRALPTLMAPDWLGAISGKYTGPSDITQYYFYAGILLLPLAALGVVKTKLRLRALVLAVPAAWYMLGPSAGLYRLGALAPGLYKVRAPVQGWFVVALGLALLAAAGLGWILERWRVAYLPIVAIAFIFADLWYWKSFTNPLAYMHDSFDAHYGANEERLGGKIASSQPAISRFDAPRYLAVFGPLDHPLDLKLEATYGYFALEPALYDDYAAAMEKNPKLRDGLNVSRYVTVNPLALHDNPTVLPRAYFPHAIQDVHGEAESRAALDRLDPSAQSVVLAPHAAVRQDPGATAAVTASGEGVYRIRYHAASPSLLKLSVAWYPGWQAFAAGRELPVLRVDHALMGVVAPAGDGEVEFQFRSRYFGVGLALSIAGLVAAGLLVGFSRPKRQEMRPGLG